MKLKENNFFYLLGGLLITLLVAPIASQDFREVLSFAFLGTLLVGVWSLHESKGIYRVGWLLTAVMVVLAILENVALVPPLFIANATVLLLFCLLTTAFALRQVLFADEVDANRIAGAVCIYMLAGLNWAAAYSLLHIVDAGSFDGLAPIAGSETVFLDLLYYSYVTLTTLGYGDITPASRVAQALSYLEAISGVMYLTVLVAALVGAYAYKGQRKAAART